MLVCHRQVSGFKLLLGPSVCVLDQRIRETFFFSIVYLAVVRIEGCATVTLLPLFYQENILYFGCLFSF